MHWCPSSVCLSVRLSRGWLTLSREEKGLARRTQIWQEESPWHGRPVTIFRGRRVKQLPREGNVGAARVVCCRGTTTSWKLIGGWTSLHLQKAKPYNVAPLQATQIVFKQKKHGFILTLTHTWRFSRMWIKFYILVFKFADVFWKTREYFFQKYSRVFQNTPANLCQQVHCVCLRCWQRYGRFLDVSCYSVHLPSGVLDNSTCITCRVSFSPSQNDRSSISERRWATSQS